MRVEFRKALIVVLVVVLSYFNTAGAYYNPTVGRFSRMDPYTGRIEQPQSLHKYVYVHNNPVNRRDPTGLYTSVTETNVSTAIQVDIGLSIGANALLLNTMMNRGYDIGQTAAEREIELFVQTAPQPFTQADFENLEQRVKIKKRRRVGREILYMHYSFEYHKESLLDNGLFDATQLPPFGSYATRKVYPTGWHAKWFLALDGLPRDSIYIVMPRYGYGPTSQGPVPSNPINGMGGQGYQYIFGRGSGGPGTVFGPIPLPVGLRQPWMY